MLCFVGSFVKMHHFSTIYAVCSLILSLHFVSFHFGLYRPYFSGILPSCIVYLSIFLNDSHAFKTLQNTQKRSFVHDSHIVLFFVSHYQSS